MRTPLIFLFALGDGWYAHSGGPQTDILSHGQPNKINVVDLWLIAPHHRPRPSMTDNRELQTAVSSPFCWGMVPRSCTADCSVVTVVLNGTVATENVVLHQ